MKYDFICHETARLVTGNILDGNVCGGRSCKMYKTCNARIEFDSLTKHTPTDAQIKKSHVKCIELYAEA